MPEREVKSLLLDLEKRLTLLNLLSQGETAGSSSWRLFWQDLLENTSESHEKDLDRLFPIFEEGIFHIFSSKLDPDNLIFMWIKEITRVAKSCGADQMNFSEQLLIRQVYKQMGQRDQVRPQTSSTREKILAAALEVFSSKGFHGTTVDEIAERAELGKGTVYRHFNSKRGLFSELIRLKVAELEKTVSAAIDPHADVLEIIQNYLRIYFGFFDHNRELYRVLIQEQSDFGAEVKALYIGNILKKVPLLKRKILHAARNGRLKQMDFHTVFYGVMGFIDGVIQKWLASEEEYSLVDEVPTVIETIFYGFVNYKPSQLLAENEPG